jgi:two-component system nitrogen regulation sensor histidine kinase NtrY
MDNGPGLSSEERSRVFEPYYSRKKIGTGLGLTIVKSIISDHHGYVRVKANEPQGSIFVIELPMAA